MDTTVHHPEGARARSALRTALRQLGEPAAGLLPMRVFIGLGWLRAAVEKLLDPTWLAGDGVRTFVEQQLADGAVAFAGYESFAREVVLPLAPTVAAVVVVLQLVAGFCVLTGTLTRLGLLVGLFLSMHFLLAGAVNPSAFYIVIQLTLLVTGAEKVFAVDRRLRCLPRTRGLDALLLRQPFVLARPAFLVLCGGLLGLAAVVALPSVASLRPAEVVEDPAAMAALLLGLGAATSVQCALRLKAAWLEHFALGGTDGQGGTVPDHAAAGSGGDAVEPARMPPRHAPSPGPTAPAEAR